MAKIWNKMNADEKAEWLKAELKQVSGVNARLSNLYAMLSSQIQEIARAVKAIEKKAAGKD